MTADQIMRIGLHDRTIEIISSSEDFMAYLKKQFLYQIIQEPSDQQQPDISLHISWSKSALSKMVSVEKSNLRRIATNTYINDTQCVYMDKINGRRTKVDLTIEGRRLRIFVVQEEKKYRRLFKKDNDELMREACYHFVYYPLFFHLQHFSGIYPLHAAAFKVSGKIFVFAGLDKMGKTTLALQSLQRPEALFISDNIIFHDEKSIFPCYAPLKISNENRFLIPESFREITRSKDRAYFSPPASSEREHRPDYIIVPCFSREPFTKEMPPAVASSTIMNSNMLASEMKEYFNAATLWNLIIAGDVLLIKQNNALAQLLNQAKCYHFGIGRAETPYQTLERLANLANRKEQYA